jgi:hypothetical protein
MGVNSVKNVFSRGPQAGLCPHPISYAANKCNGE